MKILIVDDSIFFREVLSRSLLSKLPSGTQVEKAGNPFEARDKILSFDPDVMILDVEMPQMNGIEFLRRLIVQYALPTVVLSSRPAYKTLALEAGAFEFFEKPSATLGNSSFVSQLINALIKAKAENDANIVQSKTGTRDTVMAKREAGEPARGNSFVANMSAIVENMKNMSQEMKKYRGKEDSGRTEAVSSENLKVPVPQNKVQLIAIGASTGGTEALSAILKKLVPPLPPIVIVQHIPPMFSRLFSERLNNECRISVKEAEDGDVLQPNWVYVAPGDRQMSVRTVGGTMVLNVNKGERVNGHCPSVDVLFNSVADKIGARAMGVILTGMGEDGARGIEKMRLNGSVTLGQDEASCVVYGMPRAAYERGGIVQQLPLSAMANAITAVATHPGGR